MQELDTGLLLHKQDIELHRNWFKEMCHLIGINILFRSPVKSSKHYDLHGDLDSKYNTPIVVGCIFDEHPTQWTMKKLGWNAEQNDSTSVIHLPYDLEGLEAGSLCIIPSGIDNSKGRVFRIIRMSTTQVYPASIACEIAPEYEDTTDRSSIESFETTNFNLLNGGN